MSNFFLNVIGGILVGSVISLCLPKEMGLAARIIAVTMLLIGIAFISEGGFS